MKTVSIHEGKTHFSQLVSEAEKGEHIEVTRYGKVVARIVPAERPARRRLSYGALRNDLRWANMTPEMIAAALAPMTDKELEEEGWI